MNTLNELRDRVRQIDAQLLNLVRDRLECARRIGVEKKRAGVPLRDWEVEKAVMDRAAESARQLGIPPKLASQLMQHLIAGSRSEQERETFSTYSGQAERILIVGGLGKMGRWFAEFFGNQGHRILIWDASGGTGTRGGESPGSRQEPPPPKLTPSPNGPAGEIQTASLIEGLSAADITVIATPLESVPQVIAEITDAGYRGVVFDIASLKGHLQAAINRAKGRGVSIASVHSMFGPATRALSGQVICLCDCGDPEALQRVRRLFAETAASLVELSLDEHDRIASCVLGLSHLMNLLFAGVLRNSGISFATLDRVGSTTFHSQMETTATVIRDNAELYYAIQRLNPYTQCIYELLQTQLDQLTAAVGTGDRQRFVDLMHAGREWLESAEGTRETDGRVIRTC